MVLIVLVAICPDITHQRSDCFPYVFLPAWSDFVIIGGGMSFDLSVKGGNMD